MARCLPRVIQTLHHLNHNPTKSASSLIAPTTKPSIRHISNSINTTMSTPDTDITLYTWGTPNGQKVSIVLEELGLKYQVEPIDISKNVQKEDWFLRINPNGRIPAIVDRTPRDGKPQQQRVFEGAAILLYLTQRYDPQHKLSYPYDSPEYWETVSFLAWQHGGLGPMQGQANHFKIYAPEKIPYGVERYVNETKRLYSVMEMTLAQQAQANNTEEGPWLVGDRCTIADLACFSWAIWVDKLDVDIIDEFKHVKDWLDRIKARPAIQRGLQVPKRD